MALTHAIVPPKYSCVCLCGAVWCGVVCSVCIAFISGAVLLFAYLICTLCGAFALSIEASNNSQYLLLCEFRLSHSLTYFLYFAFFIWQLFFYSISKAK